MAITKIDMWARRKRPVGITYKTVEGKISNACVEDRHKQCFALYCECGGCRHG